MNISELIMMLIPAVLGLLIIVGAAYHDYAVWRGWRS